MPSARRVPVSLPSFTALILAGCAAPAHAPTPMTWPTLDADFLTASSATLGFKLGAPAFVGFAPDGALLFRRTGPRSRTAELFQLDAAGHVTRLASADDLLAGADEHLSDADKARRERTRTVTQGIVDVELSTDGARVLVPLGDRMFVIDRASGKAHAVDVGGYPYDPHLSPDGKRIGYVLDGDLWVVDVDGGTPRRLTTRPGPDVEHGVAEFVAQEELGRTRGWWWSPDGARLAYQRTDNSRVDTLYVADPVHPDAPPVPFRYPRAGRPNADVQLGVIGVGGGATTWATWDRAKYPYVAGVMWDVAGGPLALTLLDRDQNDVAVVAVDTDTGKTLPMVSEHDDAWIDLPQGAPRWLDDGSAWLWMSERSGEWQLQLLDPRGALDRTLTPAGFGLRALAGVDTARRVAWVTASPDPTRSDVWLVPLDGKPATRVTTAPGEWSAVTSERGDRALLIGALADGSLAFELHGSDGRKLADVPSVVEAPPYLPHPVLETVELGGRRHAAVIIRPRAFDPSRRYPVLLHVYGGPTVRMVSISPRAYLMDQWYADAGFVVVRIDGRGTPHQGRAWSRAVLRDLVTVPLADQVDVLHALGARHKELDLDRVGIYGWSFGGYLSAMAVLLRPDVFRCGVAGAPVTDWSLYDTAYTERYMKQPSENPDGYRATSAITHAAELTRPLLIIHGLTDDNVHLANSLALVQALFAAGKRADFVPLSSTHMVPDPKILFAREKLQIDYFREHLGP